MKEVNGNQKLQKVQSKLSLKAHSGQKLMKEGKNDQMIPDLRSKISLANFMKKWGKCKVLHVIDHIQSYI